MPQKCAGTRNDPPVSEPNDSGPKPAASAAADPPDDPPGTRGRLKVGKRLSEDGFIVAQPDGSPLRPHSLGQMWTRFLADHPALPRIRYHDLRHTHATHMLKAGVHPKIASERLGHSKIGITLDLYSHVLPNMQADAAAIVDEALAAAVKKG